jgi:hypothetical protein
MWALPPYHKERGRRRSNFVRRLRRNPNRFVFWDGNMPAEVERHCVNCGLLFRVTAERTLEAPIAPPSVARLHVNAYCSKICVVEIFAPIPASLPCISASLKGQQLAQAVFERDNWHCYLCGVSTPAESKGSMVAPVAPQMDHYVPWGEASTDEPDNLRCACRRCNNLKGNSLVWDHICGRTIFDTQIADKTQH